MIDIFEGLRARIADIPLTKRVGKISALTGGTVRVSGLSQGASLGDRVLIHSAAPQLAVRFCDFQKKGSLFCPMALPKVWPSMIPSNWLAAPRLRPITAGSGESSILLANRLMGAP